MRPIYDKALWSKLHVLKNCVDGVTQNLKLKGDYHVNITKDAKQIDSDLKTGVGITLDNDLFKDPRRSDSWTLMFKVVSTTIKQDTGFNKGIVSIGETLRHHNDDIVQQALSLAPGVRHAIPLEIRKEHRNKPNAKLWLSVEQGFPDEAKISLEDVMLVPGTYRKPFETYFEGTKGAGPTFNFISHSKNLFHEDYWYPRLWLNSNTIRKDDVSDILQFFIPIKPNTDYVLSYDLTPLGVKNNRFTKNAFNEVVPRDGLTGYSFAGTYTKSGNHVVWKVNSGDSKMLGFYLGFGQQNVRHKLSDLAYNIQFEEGTVETKYERPCYSNHQVTLPRELKENETFEYDPEYKTYVIKVPRGSSPTTNDVLMLSDIPNIWLNTFEGTTWTAVVDEHGLNPQAEFDYLTKPSTYIFKHKEVLVVLKSGEVINTRWYRTVDKKPDTITFKNGFHCEPEKTILVSDITKVIHLD